MHNFSLLRRLAFQITVLVYCLPPRLGLCEQFIPFKPFREYSTPDSRPFLSMPPMDERPFSDIQGLNLPQFPDLNIPFQNHDAGYDALEPPQVTLPPYAEPEYPPFGDMRPMEQPPLEDEVLQPFAPFRPMD